MKIYFEARIHDTQKASKHYDSHVLKPNEKFNRNNPKFPVMTLERYLDEGEILSLEHAGPLGSDDPIVGWVIQDHNTFRNFKIRKESKFVPGFSDVVIYETDFSDIENTFMLVQQRRIKKYENLYYCDLGNFNN